MKLQKLKHLIITLLLFLFPYQVYADVIGVQLGAGVWNHAASGNVRDNGTVNFDLEKDLKLKDKQDGYFYIAVEHPVPLIPNIKFASTKMSHNGTGTLTVTATFNGKNFVVNDVVTSDIVLDSTDLTLYYEILDNVVEVDVGITARSLEGKVRLVSTTETAEQKISETIPLIYAALSFNLPAGFSLNGETNFISVGDVSYTDLSVKVRYEVLEVFGVEGGIRSQNLTLKNVSNVTAGITFNGPFVGAYFHF